MRQNRGIHPDPLHAAAGKDGFVLHVVELVFQRGAAGIDDENVHTRSPSLS
ncbi:hypothetical protein BN871_HR_00210 [Paenibacillus sp. P22]|nr:hypothetical protein BN871_HR_00210 [Paenibacillus sp. P22]